MVNLAIVVGMLDGYLNAMRDLNDMHDGTRFWFGAHLVEVDKRNTESAIRDFCKGDNVTIRKIDLKEELVIIESYILKNYLLGTSNPDSEEQNYIKNLHGWRIQEYIAMAGNYERCERWVAEIIGADSARSDIFIEIGNKLVAVRLGVSNL